jgi:hypothetical protein
VSGRARGRQAASGKNGEAMRESFHQQLRDNAYPGYVYGYPHNIHLPSHLP